VFQLANMCRRAPRGGCLAGPSFRCPAGRAREFFPGQLQSNCRAVADAQLQRARAEGQGRGPGQTARADGQGRRPGQTAGAEGRRRGPAQRAGAEGRLQDGRAQTADGSSLVAAFDLQSNDSRTPVKPPRLLR
jgi:hypothetical protein